jgi:hypothetical protein
VGVTYEGSVQDSSGHDGVLGIETVPNSPSDEQNTSNHQHGNE